MIKFKPTSKLQKEGLKIVQLLKRNGFKAFWVGGTVRDVLLKREIDNLDIATSARPDQVEQVLGKAGYKTKAVGRAYGTILATSKFGPVELTTFRKEGQYIQRRRPQEVIYIDDYYKDSQRRDLTINAMYFDPIEKILLDPQKGKVDLKRKLIKFVGDPKKRIDEDALRMLRAVRLATQLQFRIENNSFAAIKTRAKYIQHISGERIKAELDKILISKNKEEGVRLLDGIGLLKFIMPEVYALKNVHHKSKVYHLEGSVFEHTMLALKNSPHDNLILAYAALYHDAGKATTAVPKTKPEGVVNSFPNHENVSADLFKSLAKRLKFSRKEVDSILWITKMHMSRMPFIRDMSEKKKLVLAKHKYFPLLIQMWRVDQLSKLVNEHGSIVTAKPSSYREGIKLLRKIESKKNLINQIVKGKFIMSSVKIKSGPRVGLLKNVLENKIIYGEIKNIADARKFLKNYEKNT
ncbi:MAG: CCA tRNA nucleotidyltransferase [Candidatus Doudnabacteria bacterium]|nr:CCA tRNA nucleotidyltransferase [Candidatus Doudnabacteria bacterium]